MSAPVRQCSVLELITRFEAVNDLKLPYKYVGRRAGDIPAIWADTSRANAVLGWKAERTLDRDPQIGLGLGEASSRSLTIHGHSCQNQPTVMAVIV